MVLDVHRNQKAWGGGGIIYLSYTVTTRMTPALRWAVMRAILMFHNCDGQSRKTVSTDHNFWREEESWSDIRTEVPPLTSLTARPNWHAEEGDIRHQSGLPPVVNHEANKSTTKIVLVFFFCSPSFFSSLFLKLRKRSYLVIIIILSFLLLFFHFAYILVNVKVLCE